ncbi:MAG: polysaccharide biosynthesis protein [Bacteroidota bacterium]
MLDLHDKSLLITGGTGFLGKEIASHILFNYSEIKRLVIFSRDEQKQNLMSREFPIEKYPQLEFIIGDVRDKERLIDVFSEIDYVIHTAAMKHVHISEDNPSECVKTNVGGAENVINACLKNNVKIVVALSTDKACKPESIYGASKLISDRLFISANSFKNEAETKFTVVRCGNIFGSTGSIVPYFKDRLKKSQTLPITDDRMSRFNISNQNAVELIFYALENTWGGELFVPKSSSYRIIDLAKAICEDCKISIIGKRPGEKLFEEMISNDDSHRTYDLKKCFAILPNKPRWNLDDYIKTMQATKVQNNFQYNSRDNNTWETVESLKNKLFTKSL